MADLRDVDGRWVSSYGVKKGGAVLVRPDGIIAWRARDHGSDAEETLHEFLLHYLAPNPTTHEN
jgi:putative polyketide hydroxylase